MSGKVALATPDRRLCRNVIFIQEMLGHSSINITEIYTHVAMSKQRDILTTKHPRKDFKI